MKTVAELTRNLVAGKRTERERAVAIHDFVREHVRYGFSRYFESPNSTMHTINMGYGHSNPQTTLIVEMFRKAGLEAHQHFVLVNKDVIKGIIPADIYHTILPQKVCHSFAEVRVEGRWCAIDSYVLDDEIRAYCQFKLREENLRVGYGGHVQGTNRWQGRGDAFSQFFADEMLLEDHGRVENLARYYSSKQYRHKMFGVPLNSLFNFALPMVAAAWEKRINNFTNRCRENYHLKLV